MLFQLSNHTSLGLLACMAKFFLKVCCFIYNAKQVIAGHIHAQTGSSYFGMAMKDMHILTSPLLLNQHQHHILWHLGGSVILVQAVNESRWCEILIRKTCYTSAFSHYFCLFAFQVSGHNKIIQHASFLGFSTIPAWSGMEVLWVLVWLYIQYGKSIHTDLSCTQNAVLCVFLYKKL